MTARQALVLTGISAGALGLAFAAGRWTAPRDRTEHTRQATAQAQGEAQTQSRGTEATEGTREAQEREGSREETRTPDGVVRVVTRWKQGETREKVVVQKVVEVQEVIKWQTKTVTVEKLVEVKAPPVQLPRWSLSIGPAWSVAGSASGAAGAQSASALARPDGIAMGAGVRVVGPWWAGATVVRAGSTTAGALTIGVQW